MRNAAVLSLVVLSCFGPPGRADEKSVAEGLKAILVVGKEAAGNAEAAAGWKAVVAGKAKALIPTLKAFAGASPAARNWLKTAVAGIADGEKSVGRKLPVDVLVTFVKDHANDPKARAAAFELVRTADPTVAAALLDSCQDDPSVELRRAAIDRSLATAEKMSGAERDAVHRRLFAFARDFDQVEDLAKKLELTGRTVDLASHFGYLATWHVVGPFDSTDGAGFAKSFPAETGFDPSKTYAGKDGKSIGWKTITAIPKQPNYDPKGSPFYDYVDLNKELGKSMDAVAYAASQFTIEKETPCEIRVGCQNAIQIFLNGKKLFEREAYHHGYYPDQHSCAGVLKAGKNEVVLKVIQNNQKEPWAQFWAFNCRVCDATGGKLPITTFVPPMPGGEVKK